MLGRHINQYIHQISVHLVQYSFWKLTFTLNKQNCQSNSSIRKLWKRLIGSRRRRWRRTERCGAGWLPRCALLHGPLPPGRWGQHLLLHCKGQCIYVHRDHHGLQITIKISNHQIKITIKIVRLTSKAHNPFSALERELCSQEPDRCVQKWRAATLNRVGRQVTLPRSSSKFQGM